MESRIKEASQINVEFKLLKLSSYWQNSAPPQRIYEFLVALGNLEQIRQADAVMNSPQMLKAMATQIIDSCPNIGAVSYNQKHTGYTRTFGLLPNGVREFECVEIDHGRNISGRTLSWGQQVCDL